MGTSRRDFLKCLAPLVALPTDRQPGGPHMADILDALGRASSNAAPSPHPDTPDWRSHFPTLAQKVNGFPLAYLDTAATAQRPAAVTRAVVDFYDRDNANPGRTLHALARRADEDYESSRRTVAGFINAADPLEIVFTRGTTEGINLVATAWGGANLRRGDEILLTVSEHASNMLPWQLAAKRAGATVRYLDIDDEGHLRLDQLDALITPRTKIFSFMHVSNVLGLINPAKELCAIARRSGVITAVDAAQSVPHIQVDVQDMGCDFLAFSGHKMMGPMGTGVLWGRRALLDAMPPYQAGSNMAHAVSLDSADYSPGALKFGAGTPNVSGPVGLAAAMRFIDAIGYVSLREHEQRLTRRALSLLSELPGVRILGSTLATERIGVLSFVVDGVQSQDVVTALDAKGIAIRGGDLASLPLLTRLGVKHAARASIYLYTTVEEIDRLVDALKELGSNS
jgi:cysteine desulfurase/selenocysteine lyase